MKVLQLISSGGCYGGETMLISLVAALETMGCENIIGVFRNSHVPHTEIAEQARKRNLRVEVIPCGGRIDAKVTGQIGRLVQERGIGLVHTHGYKADIYGYLATRRLRKPIIATCHNWTGQNTTVRIYEMLDRQVLRYFHRVVAVSENVVRTLRKAGVSEKRVTVIGNGIDISTFQEARPTFAEKVGKGKRIAVGMVGRLVPEKGPQHLLAAAREILARFPETLFVFVGDGPAGKQLEESARVLRIDQSVIFAGQRNDMPEVYASLDIFVLPSLLEAMPMSIMEAMAAGKPVVATRVGAIPGLIRDGDTGLLIDPGDPAALRDAMVRLLDNVNLRRDLAARGQQWAVDHFSSETMAHRYLALYEDIWKWHGAV